MKQMKDISIWKKDLLKNSDMPRNMKMVEIVQFSFSAPGRSEIIGNHTDHNGGRVIAAAIDMDTIAAAAPNETDIIRIYSEGHEYIEVDLKSIADYVNNYNTDAKYAIYTTVADRLLREYVRIL